jgi:hypothetical protein
MAFTFTTLAPIGGGGDVKHYSYDTGDAIATVIAASYFNGAVDFLNVDDWIMVNASDGHYIVYVASNDGTDVDVTDGTNVTSSDGS